MLLHNAVCQPSKVHCTVRLVNVCISLKQIFVFMVVQCVEFVCERC